MPISIPIPQLQIDFAFALEQIRGQYLQQALSETVAKLSVTDIDAQLAHFVPPGSLTQLASRGLRGELMFAVPVLLTAAPRLLGYYRLLLGFSQKAFYTSQFGLTGFKSMEEKGLLTAAQAKRLDELCSGLIDAAVALLEGIGAERVTRDLLQDLALLTVGPQLRGWPQR